MLRRLLGENIALDFQFAEVPMPIDADIGMIEQLVTNICVNARDAMLLRGGRLSVRTEIAVLRELPPDGPPEAYPGRFVRLSIADTGCGMNATTLAHLFEPFFTTKEIGKGTGPGALRPSMGSRSNIAAGWRSRASSASAARFDPLSGLGRRRGPVGGGGRARRHPRPWNHPPGRG